MHFSPGLALLSTLRGAHDAKTIGKDSKPLVVGKDIVDGHLSQIPINLQGHLPGDCNATLLAMGPVAKTEAAHFGNGDQSWGAWSRGTAYPTGNLMAAGAPTSPSSTSCTTAESKNLARTAPAAHLSPLQGLLGQDLGTRGTQGSTNAGQGQGITLGGSTSLDQDCTKFSLIPTHSHQVDKISNGLKAHSGDCISYSASS